MIARLLYVIIAIVFIVIVVKSNTARLKQHQKELEKQIHKATELIESSHKEITDSIIYAKRIQYAILPRIGKVRDMLKGIFVFYQPKDIVSGDFFWTAIVKNKIFVAVVDMYIG